MCSQYNDKSEVFFFLSFFSCFFSRCHMCQYPRPFETLPSSQTLVQHHLGRFDGWRVWVCYVGLKLPLFRVKLWMSKAISFTDKCHYIQSKIRHCSCFQCSPKKKMRSSDALKSKFMRYFCIWSQCVKAQMMKHSRTRAHVHTRTNTRWLRILVRLRLRTT